MFMFIDGRPVVLSFALVESLYYKAFMERFPESGVSITQWRGSYEYQAIYPDIQMIVETGVITRDAMAFIGNSIVQANEAIKRPACLYSRVPERFKELGYEATIRIADATNKGTVAICVDQERAAPPETKRIMTIAQDPSDPDAAGFSSYATPPYGALSNATYDGMTIIRLTSYGDGADKMFMRLDFGTETPPSVIYSWFDSFGPVIFNAVASGDYGGADGIGLAEHIRNNIGSDIGFYLSANPIDLSAPDDALIATTIRDEMLPAGQHMVGSVVYQTALSNGQPIDIRWEIPNDFSNDYRVTITRKRGSPYPEHTVDQIIDIFNANFDEAMGIGADITPQVYLTVRDLPWASSVLVEWKSNNDGLWYDHDVTMSYVDRASANLPPANVVIQ